MKVGTVNIGYGDGYSRQLSNKGKVWIHNQLVDVLGRVSMDMIGVDITLLDHDPESLDILSPYQTIDDLADMAGTIGYEILTSLGMRYARRYVSQ